MLRKVATPSSSTTPASLDLCFLNRPMYKTCALHSSPFHLFVCEDWPFSGARISNPRSKRTPNF